MKWYCGLEPIVSENVSLARHTWYGLGGSARYFCTPTNLEELCEVVRRVRSCDLPLKILGGGANVLVRDEGFDGAVVRLGRQAFGKTVVQDGVARAGGSVDLPDFVRRTVRANLTGLECLAGIPGTVGGAVHMNAGGKFGDIGQSVATLRFVDHNGSVAEWDKEKVLFEYRKTNLADRIIVEVTFDLQAADPDDLRRRYSNIWDYKKSRQPFTRNNAGCVFKNPTGLHAGQLIDRAGLKGESCGGASVCERHANFIVTQPDTKANEVLSLIDRVRSRVHEHFHIDLELEVDVW